MKCYKKYLCFLLIFTCITSSFSQETLSKEAAISTALEYNYGILIAKNNLKIATNNASIYNSGFLPKVTAASGINYSNNSTDYTSQSSVKSSINNAESTTYNGSIGLSFTLFDGLGRSYNYKKLKETYQLTELEAKALIENTLLQLFNAYFEVAQLTEESKNVYESFTISKQRLQRTSYAFEYGQTTKLQLLNAEVDVNNDSIKYLNLQQLLANSKRNLNLLLGKPISTNFTVDTNITFNNLFTYQEVLEKATKNNIDIKQLEKSIVLNQLDIKINKADLLPTLNLNSSYGINKTVNDGTYTYANLLSKGLSAGITLNWNIFDGGFTKTRIDNSKIIANNLQIQQQQLNATLEKEIANAIASYSNALYILQAEEKNVETNIRNFNRTEEQFKLGQISSIEFRQAQLNLLNAQSNYNQAKYAAKNAEIYILQLSGDILNITF